MIDAVLAKIFGTKNEREIKAMRPTIAAVNDLETSMRQLSDIDLAAKTIEFKEKLAQGATLDDLLVEAFAVGREAGRRVLNMRHFDVQLIGGMVLHKGRIAEMKTGEGKTLVATLPSYLNALEGKGVHIITVNDYLATPNGWAGCTASWASPSAPSSTTSTTTNASKTTAPTLLTARTTSLDSIICATT